MYAREQLRSVLTCLIFTSLGLLLALLLASPAAVGQNFSKSYAVVIGVNSVPSSRLPQLTHPEDDARAVADLLEHQGFEVTRLIGKDAKKLNIVSELTSLAHRLSSQDRVLVYFAGHGHSETFGTQKYGYLVPYDGDDTSATYLSMGEIRDLSDKMGRARHVLFILDSCFGGLLGTRSGGLDPTLPDYVHQAADRVARQVIAAGGADQVVVDVSAHAKHSLFTQALLEGLRDGQADKRGDGFILVPDLMSYLISRASNAYQSPISADLPGHGEGEFIFASPKPKTKQTQPSEPIQGLQRGGPVADAKAVPLDGPAIKAILDDYGDAMASGDLEKVKAVREVRGFEEKEMIEILKDTKGKGFALRKCSAPDVTGLTAIVSCDMFLTKGNGTPPANVTFYLKRIYDRWFILSSN